MRLIQISELRDHEIDTIRDYLCKKTLPSEIETLHWLELPYEILDDEQKCHFECMPYYFAVEIGLRNFINFELLVRSRKKIRCTCIKYANKTQRDFLLNFIDNMIHDLGIRV